MKTINVVDLDGTLIPFDSFRSYILLFLFKKRFTLKIIFLSLSRLVGFIDGLTFKKKIYLNTYRFEDYDTEMRNFAKKLINSIDTNIIDKVNENSNKEVLNILVTASYKSYSKYIAKYLGWDCLASNLVGGEFYHVYGLEKINQLIKYYPSGEYKYNFCISDSISDMELLNKFEKSELIKRKSISK